jgi:hypothetical protein
MIDTRPWNITSPGPTQAPDSGYTSCEGSGFTSLMDNMIIFAGADYFSNAGELDGDKLASAAADLSVLPVNRPEFDPIRVGTVIGVNAGAPLTHDGKIGYQVGFLYNQAEFGAQGFFTTGIFHRCDPCDKHGINWGVVYDAMYDNYIDYAVGQVRFKFGYAITKRDELGAWFNLATNDEIVNVDIRTLTCGIDGCEPPVFTDTIEARISAEQQGHFFWHHVFKCGFDATVTVGAREELGGTLILGGMTQHPLSDSCALITGGHWSHDAEDVGSYNVYMGIAIYPGHNARQSNACGSRFMPYQEVANNTFMGIFMQPRKLIVQGAQGPAEAPL